MYHVCNIRTQKDYAIKSTITQVCAFMRIIFATQIYQTAILYSTAIYIIDIDMISMVFFLTSCSFRAIAYRSVCSLQ